MIAVLIGISFLTGLIIGKWSSLTFQRRQKFKVKPRQLTIYTDNLDLADRLLTVLRSDTLKIIDDIKVKDIKRIQVIIKVLGEFERWKEYEDY